MNSKYAPALADSLFLLDKVLDWRQLFALPEFAHADAELATAVLTEGAKFVCEVIAPINASGDKQGSVLAAGKVITPAGFRDAYTKFAAAGWVGLDLPEKYGGQNLPLTVQVAFAEMLNGACLSFSMLPIMLRLYLGRLGDAAKPLAWWSRPVEWCRSDLRCGVILAHVQLASRQRLRVGAARNLDPTA